MSDFGNRAALDYANSDKLCIINGWCVCDSGLPIKVPITYKTAEGISDKEYAVVRDIRPRAYQTEQGTLQFLGNYSIEEVPSLIQFMCSNLVLNRSYSEKGIRNSATRAVRKCMDIIEAYPGDESLNEKPHQICPVRNLSISLDIGPLCNLSDGKILPSWETGKYMFSATVTPREATVIRLAHSNNYIRK